MDEAVAAPRCRITRTPQVGGQWAALLWVGVIACVDFGAVPVFTAAEAAHKRLPAQLAHMHPHHLVAAPYAAPSPHLFSPPRRCAARVGGACLVLASCAPLLMRRLRHAALA